VPFFISHLSPIVQHSKYTLNPEKPTWSFHYPSLNFSVPFCFSSIFIQQFHHHSPQITPLLIICVLLTKVFLSFNSTNPFPLIVLLLGRVANIPRQSHGKTVQIAACGMVSLVIWKPGKSLDWASLAACFMAPSIPIILSSLFIIFRSSISLSMISTPPIFLLDLVSFPIWHILI